MLIVRVPTGTTYAAVKAGERRPDEVEAQPGSGGVRRLQARVGVPGQVGVQGREQHGLAVDVDAPVVRSPADRQVLDGGRARLPVGAGDLEDLGVGQVGWSFQHPAILTPPLIPTRADI